jgi:hypothetical protein
VDLCSLGVALLVLLELVSADLSASEALGAQAIPLDGTCGRRSRRLITPRRFVYVCPLRHTEQLFIPGEACPSQEEVIDRIGATIQRGGWQLLREALMYKIRIDALKNRLYVQLEGFFSFDDMKRCVDETMQESGKLKPGYTVITDISQLKTPSQEVAAEIERVQAHFVKSGVTHGVRVVGGSVISGIQFKRTGAHAGYQSVNVNTMDEAEKLLNALS